MVLTVINTFSILRFFIVCLKFFRMGGRSRLKWDGGRERHGETRQEGLGGGSKSLHIQRTYRVLANPGSFNLEGKTFPELGERQMSVQRIKQELKSAIDKNCSSITPSPPFPKHLSDEVLSQVGTKNLRSAIL